MALRRKVAFFSVVLARYGRASGLKGLRTRRLYAPVVGVLFVAAMTTVASAAPVVPGSASPGFLTGPSSEKPLAIVAGYLRQHLADYGLQPGDVDDVVATKVVTGSDSGATYVYLQQRHRGIDVNLAVANAGVMPDGRLIALDSRFVGGLDAKVKATRPAVSREAAAGAAAQALGLTGRAAFRVVRKIDGAAQAAELSSGGISRSTIPVRLVYEPTGGGVRLAWEVGIQELDARHWWTARVDAATGALLSKSDYVDEDTFAPAGVADGSSYGVFAPPDDSPNSGPRTVERTPGLPQGEQVRLARHGRRRGAGVHDPGGQQRPRLHRRGRRRPARTRASRTAARAWTSSSRSICPRIRAPTSRRR